MRAIRTASSAFTNVMLSAIPAGAAQGPGVSAGSAGPIAQTLAAGITMVMLAVVVYGMTRGAVCCWRAARR